TMGSISLLVGGIGIMNVMLVSVAERRKEIGLRMAVGAPPSAIIALFLVESVVLTSLGGILGLALGAGGAMLMGYFTDVPYFFSTLAAVLGVGVSGLIGIFFGYYPAFMASRLNPIDALNTE
ncbi:MAG: FtsX-like permease family protein, partial [Gammaproteobacteria bacterium]|nr:FtsX-like permease family protein [Gammaproteobacteria bacterium]